MSKYQQYPELCDCSKFRYIANGKVRCKVCGKVFKIEPKQEQEKEEI